MSMHWSHRWIFGSLLGLVGLALLAIGALAVTVYGAGQEQPWVQKIATVVPLPAASIGWHPIWLANWIEIRQGLGHYSAQLHANNPTVFPAVSASDIRQQAMDKVIRDTATLALLNRQKIQLSQADVDQAFTAQLVQGGDRKATEQTIQELYDWSPEQFKANIIRVAVAREKLREYLSFNDQLNADVKKQAEQVLKLLQAGDQSFEDLAKTYSEDAYAAQGGDLGFITRGTLAEEIENAAFNLNVGETSDLIHTKFGFHIIKVVEEREQDGQRQVHVRQIFIAAPSVDDYIDAYLKSAGVRVWLRGLDWNNRQANVQLSDRYSTNRLAWSRWSGLNRRPLLYESIALPLSYTGQPPLS